MSPVDVGIAVTIGLVSGVLAGVFGVGGGIVMTPGIQVLLGAPPIVALATPLPVILPTALAGALAYRRRGEVDVRAATWLAGPGVVAAVLGAWLTTAIDTRVLLIVTALLLAWQAISILRAGQRRRAGRPATVSVLGGIGVLAGLVSGLLGIGGGLVMVPLLAGRLGMPLKRALGTSLLAIVALVVPGAVVHGVLGHLDLWLCVALMVGSVPGARLGAAIALGARERTLRVVVGCGLLAVSILYAIEQASAILDR
ncbi:MAG TPA: sulfite exporter TauE/SafE family protein [Actinomycetota bacterium]|nr:sulfite exporter TauE/SafE family protein [Actinomycetota bacterium]